MEPNLLNESLASRAESADRSLDWPDASWKSLGRHGVWRRSIPRQFGGDDWNAVDLMIGNEALAARCLTTAFILSQREAAVRLIRRGPEAIQQQWLSRAGAGDVLTVGLSQLTTSRQHGRPSLIAQQDANSNYRLDGVIPWVTAADQAAAIVGGAMLANGAQILFILQPTQAGVSIDPPMNLAALAGSRTAQIRCNGVTIAQTDILAGPKVQVMGTGGGGGLDTSCLALGLGRAALELMQPEATKRLEVHGAVQRFGAELSQLRQQLHSVAQALAPDPERTLALRTAATLFSLQATQTALLLSKGTGFVAPHPAQRFARQALFFLVWSCPRPVAEGVAEALIKGECLS